MEAGIQAINGWQRNLIVWALLALPLGVFLLPDFQTTFGEDLLVFGVFFYLFLRTANEKRFAISPTIQPFILAILLGVLYIVGWFGVLRGYEERFSRWLAFYPVPLLLAYLVCPRDRRAVSREYRSLAMTLWIVSLALFGMVGLFSWELPQEIVKNNPFPHRSAVPSLLIFPILGGVALAARRTPLLARGRDHLPILFIASAVMLGVWCGNGKTWAMWYRAGELERAWTPFKFDAPDEIARAERKPYEAAVLYNQVRERILRKGEIPLYFNWPFFMQYRMAYQFMRKKEPPRCAYALPPAARMEPKHIGLVRNLWHQEFVWSMRDSEPDYPRNGCIWIDGEMDKEGIVYLLDCWGRVYSIHDDLPWIEWKPEMVFNDAADLELIDDAYIILRHSGDVLTSKPLDLFQKKAVIPPEYEWAVDLEIFPGGLAAAAVDHYGNLCFWGSPPESFPSYEKLHFDSPAVADLELEPEGNGYYLLDIHGAVHANHANRTPSIPHAFPLVPKALLPYWAKQDMAVDLELDPQGRGLYVYNRRGELFTIAAIPYRETYRPVKSYPFRGVSLISGVDGSLYALESNGRVVKLP